MISANRLMRYLWLGVGMIALALGTAGIVLPLLPTVPFYLLAAFCFAKSSERLHRWFAGTKLYQKYVVPFNDGNGMTWQAKLKTMALVTGVMSVSGYFLLDNHMGLMMLGGAWLLQCAAMLFFVKTRKCEKPPVGQCAK
ncbi:YbaN family protein [uncultured Selenomonas sp.]|uniref:YbaN family protein n=1 Tax=uncultured Selenomonas sp. TaxID=159275 RepID=UPI0025F5BA97|nr:YbaN family protein [uncultured Selenomonas sp.]